MNPTTRTPGAILLAAALLPKLAAAQTIGAAHAQVLVKATASWNGKPYAAYASGKPELTVLKLTIPAHTALPWHTHPFPNAGYVLSGTLTIEDRDSGRRQTFRAGQAFAESVDDVHRGMSGNTPVVLIVTYSGIEGQKTSVPLPGQSAEY